MSFKLNNKDYKTILEFYNKKIPTSSKNMREEAEKIISMKLCRCIKKVKKGQNKKKEKVLVYVKIRFFTKKMLIFMGSNVRKIDISLTILIRKQLN